MPPRAYRTRRPKPNHLLDSYHWDIERGAFGVGLPFGRIEADALNALAEISERYGDGHLRTTPWRALLLTGIAGWR